MPCQFSFFLGPSRAREAAANQRKNVGRMFFIRSILIFSHFVSILIFSHFVAGHDGHSAIQPISPQNYFSPLKQWSVSLRIEVLSRIQSVRMLLLLPINIGGYWRRSDLCQGIHLKFNFRIFELLQIYGNN